MSKKLALFEKNVLFYKSLPSEYYPLHHTTQLFFFSSGVIRRLEADMRIWRQLHDSVSSLKTSPLFLRRFCLTRRLLFFASLPPVR
jgi:hypothetical protein